MSGLGVRVPPASFFKEESMAKTTSVLQVKERNLSQGNELKDNPSNLSSFLTEEYQEAKENGFKGMIEDYLKVRDYT